MIILDPGHGMSNRQPGVYDPGAVGSGGAQEADYALSYCLKIKAELESLGHEVVLTRPDAVQPCSLLYRIRTGRSLGPAAFVSVHFNATAAKGPADGKVKGYEVLWRTPGSEALASAVCAGLEAAGRMKLGAGVLQRPDLAVLSLQNSVLVEVGFIDDADDFELISDTEWSSSTCKVVAGAVSDHVRRDD